MTVDDALTLLRGPDLLVILSRPQAEDLAELLERLDQVAKVVKLPPKRRRRGSGG